MGHPLLDAAAVGTLPPWAEASSARRRHMERVADLMTAWAPALGAAGQEARWRAAAMCHDILRDAAPDRLRPLVSAGHRDLPDPILHGPAAAARLEEEGVADVPLLLAIASHTLGHPDLDTLGRALYLADYLDPGRAHQTAELASLRERMPAEMDGVTREVARARIHHHLRDGLPLHTDTVAFWNGLVRG